MDMFLKMILQQVNKWSKSGSIVCKYENGKAIAVKIEGKYYMYWGDTDIFLAVSDDLINWVPVVVEADGKPKPYLVHDKKNLIVDLVEPGPPAMLTEKGIVLIYNSMKCSIKR